MAEDIIKSTIPYIIGTPFARIFVEATYCLNQK